MFPRQPYFDRDVFSEFYIFPVLNLNEKCKFLEVCFTF